MNTRVIRLTIQLSAFLLGLCGRGSAQGLIVEPANIIVIHGRAYTENPKQPWAQAVAIHGAKIVAVGDDTAIPDGRAGGQ